MPNDKKHMCTGMVGNDEHRLGLAICKLDSSSCISHCLPTLPDGAGNCRMPLLETDFGIWLAETGAMASIAWVKYKDCDSTKARFPATLSQGDDDMD